MKILKKKKFPILDEKLFKLVKFVDLSEKTERVHLYYKENEDELKLVEYPLLNNLDLKRFELIKLLKYNFNLLKYDFDKDVLKVPFEYKKYFLNKQLIFFRKLKYKLRGKNKHFYDKKCLLFFKNTLTNRFITLTDLDGNVLISSTSGKVSYENNKKRKLSDLLIPFMMKPVVEFLKENHIKTIKYFIIKNELLPHVKKIIAFLERGNFYIEYMSVLKAIPHHYGQRKQKAKRL